MTNAPVRVRFAPSPTGMMHLGGLRSALFNYLFAQHSHGNFILRIEDTDRERLVPEAVQQIQDSLKWLGVDWNEGIEAGGQHGPYIQSERLELYQKYADQLVEQGKAYRDYASSERLEELRKQAQAEKRAFKFTKDMAQLESQESEKYVIRFEIKPGADVVWQDAVWGEQRWQREVLDDFVMIKSDGFPTYNFAVVVDDHLMEISHVFRGSEFLATTPKNLLVYQALEWTPPTFVHLPPVLGPDKAKLSKRHGAKSALEYQQQGYLPEAVFNYLASLGFNDGTTQEIYTKAELATAFTTERIQSSPAVFDAERLDWMNGVYIRNLSLDELLERSESFWPEVAKDSSEADRRQVLQLVHERLKFLAELPELTEFFFIDPKVDPQLLTKNYQADQASKLLEQVIAALSDSNFSEQQLENRLRALVDKQDLKPGQLFGLIRVAVTGRTAAPGLFETLHALGKEASLRRLENARQRLQA
jgi:glutamyl-tRNA synthetase